jgi:hypothetical protein
MRISGIFALGGGYDYGCYDSHNGDYKDYYHYGGYYGGGYTGHYSGYNGPPYYYGTLHYYREYPAHLCGSSY